MVAVPLPSAPWNSGGMRLSHERYVEIVRAGGDTGLVPLLRYRLRAATQ